MKPTDTQIKQAAILLEQIAYLAGMIDQIFFHGASPGDSDETFFNQNYVVRQLVAQLGWMADLGTGKLDGSEMPSVNGDAVQWLLPPSYHETAEAVQS